MSDNQIVINDLSKVYDNGFDALEDTRWTILKNKFKELLPKDLNNYEQNAYTNVALDDLYNSLIVLLLNLNDFLNL